VPSLNCPLVNGITSSDLINLDASVNIGTTVQYS
jgi:hypothetical protein